MSSFDEVVQSFYRSPDVASALVAFDAVLTEKEPRLADLYAFAQMARVNEDFRAGLTSRSGVIVEAVLRGVPPIPDGPPGPEELDLLWTEFFVTGDLAPVRRVLGVLDEPDLVRARLTAWLKVTDEETFRKYVPLFQRVAFPIVFEESRIEPFVDLDLSVALAARSGQLKFDELPFELAPSEVIRIAAKSAAVWSLRAIASQHKIIAKFCADEAMKPGGASRVLLNR